MTDPIPTARELLGLVLREARETVERSPEQVGAAVGVSGRTIRRLEDASPEMKRPRGVTLDALASFYGLRVPFVRALSEWGDASGPALIALLRQTADETLGGAVEMTGQADEMEALVLLMARRSAPRPDGGPGESMSHEPARRLFASFTHGATSWAALERSGESDDAVRLLEDFLALDRRRQRMLRDLAGDLRAARERERAAQRQER